MWERESALHSTNHFHLDAETIHNEFVDEMIKLCAFKWDCSTSDIGNHDDNDEKKKKKQTGKKNIHTKKYDKRSTSSRLDGKAESGIEYMNLSLSSLVAT